MMRSMSRISNILGSTISPPSSSAPALSPPASAAASAPSSSSRSAARRRRCSAAKRRQYSGPKKRCSALPGAAASTKRSMTGSGSSGLAPKTPATCSTMSLRLSSSTTPSTSAGGLHATSSSAPPPGPRASAVASRRKEGATLRLPLTEALPRRASSAPFAAANSPSHASALSHASSSAQFIGSSRAAGTPSEAAATFLRVVRGVKVTYWQSACSKTPGSSSAKRRHTRSNCTICGEASTSTCSTRAARGNGCTNGWPMRTSALASSRPTRVAKVLALVGGTPPRMS
mmetsp:Transcript_25673/g.73294  ORF Transcript_25673/g.73294 Transcript_25673/m.73294 type:complete len:287 (+) Transcript_25673:213-1073(+)